MAKVSGLDEFEAYVLRTNARLERELPSVVIEGARIVEDEIRHRAPRATGELLANLEVEPIRSRRAGRASAVVEVESSGPGGEVRQAIFVEFGTYKMPAHPFFRPGVDASRERSEMQMEQQITNIIKEGNG